MPNLTPLPTRVISDIEEIRPAVKDAIKWQRGLFRIAGLSDEERQTIEDVLVNLRVIMAAIDRMRSREWDVVNDAREDGKNKKGTSRPD